MLTLREPVDALVLIPHLLGYTPKRVMVLCGLDSSAGDARAQRWLTGPLFQYNYREGLSFECAEVISSIVREHRIKKAVIALYCESLEEFYDEELREQLHMIHWAARLSQGQGNFLATFVLDEHSYMRIDTPGKPVPLTQLDSREIAAQLVYQGSSPHREEIVEINKKEREEAAKAGSQADKLALNMRVRVLKALMCKETGLIAELENNLAKERAGEECAGYAAHFHTCDGVKKESEEGSLSPGLVIDELGEIKTSEAVGIASKALCHMWVRDSALVWALSGKELPAEGAIDIEDVTLSLRKIMQEKPRIDWMERSVHLLDYIAAHECAGSDEALAMGAYVYWWMGRSHSADTRAQASLTRNPSNTLAKLLAKALAEGLLPPWRDIHPLDNLPS